MTSIIFGVRLDELASVEQLRGAATGFLDGARAHRIFTPTEVDDIDEYPEPAPTPAT